MNKAFFLPALTGTALLLLVGLPVMFVILQAIFPHLDSGTLTDAFGAFRHLFSEPQLPEMVSATLKVGLGVALCSAIIGIPLGDLRGLFALPCPAPRCG